MMQPVWFPGPTLVISFYSGVIIDSIILILQVIMDLIKSDPNSHSDASPTFSRNGNGMVVVKEEEDPVLIMCPVCEGEGKVGRPRRHASDNTKLRLTERHFLRKVQRERKKLRRQRRYVVCSKHGRRKDTVNRCRECDVGLCVTEDEVPKPMGCPIIETKYDVSYVCVSMTENTASHHSVGICL
jgi:hypothetical protein